MLDVDEKPLSLDRFQSIVGARASRPLATALEQAAACLGSSTVWSVNSTAQGGGVAEMLRSLTGYLAGAGIDARWLVIDADEEFFGLTKRIHNRLHGADDGLGLDEDDRRSYERCLQPSVRDAADRIRPGDVAIVHDPQPAGLVPDLAARGVALVWRSHAGIDEPNRTARSTWDFLRPYVERAQACVFSRRTYAWSGLPRVEVIPPSIDAFSPKNQSMEPSAVDAILAASGVMDGEAGGAPATAARRPRNRELTPPKPSGHGPGGSLRPTVEQRKGST